MKARVMNLTHPALFTILSVLTVLGGGLKAEAIGNADGGGGNVVACYADAAKKNLNSVELYDLWEQRQLNPRLIYKSFAKFDQALNFVIGQLNEIDLDAPPFKEKFLVYTAQKLADEIANAEAGQQEKNWTVRFVGKEAKLLRVEDLNNFMEPEDDNCVVTALGNYRQDDKLYINSKLYKKMDFAHRAAFILHETVYKKRRSMGDKDSVYARRLVAMTFAGIPLKHPVANLVDSSFHPKSGVVKCRSISFDQPYYEFFAARNEQNPSLTDIQFDRLSSNPVLNRATAQLHRSSGFSADFFGEAYKVCDNPSPTYECTSDMSVPLSSTWNDVDKLVEQVNFTRIQRNGKVRWFVKGPGSTDQSSEFTCE
jgi:hypothetical protein